MQRCVDYRGSNANPEFANLQSFCGMTVTTTMIPSTPTSPRSPTRKRRSLRIPSIHSNHDFTSPSPYMNEFVDVSSHSRKSSQSSIQQYSPLVPRPASSRSKRPSSSRLSIGSNISTGLASNAGFGNLADELEEAWDDDLDEAGSSFLEGLQEGKPDQALHSPIYIADLHDMRMPMTPRSPTNRDSLLLSPQKPPSPSKQWASMGTHRKTESLYDGSDYGPSSDDEAFDSIAPTLQRKIHDVEEITRISTNVDSLSESGGVILRTTAALKGDLGVQSTLENISTRLITAYTSLATHRTHQAREILNAAHTLSGSSSLGSGRFDLPLETLEVLLAEIDSLSLTLPYLPTSPISTTFTNPPTAMRGLVANTVDLCSTLHSLADTLTEHRQHLLNATRRLKAVRDLVDGLRAEEELVETSIMLIQAGDWDRRCRERHAGKAVGELLEGFKKTWALDYVDGGWKPGATPRCGIEVQ